MLSVHFNQVNLKINDVFQHLQSKNRKLIQAVIFAVKLVGSKLFNFSIVLLTDIPIVLISFVDEDWING